MKKFLLVLFAAVTSNVHAQSLLFSSEYGGANGNGAVIQHNLSTNQTSTAQSLGGNPHYGFNLYQTAGVNWWHNGGLTLGSDGYYYGLNTDAHSYAFQMTNHYRGFFIE